MKHHKRAILGILAVLMMLVLGPLAPAKAEDGGTNVPVLIVGGVEVTSTNQDDILQDGGKAAYNPTTGTLTFNNPTFEAGLGSAIYAQNLDLTISGDVNATGTSFGIYVENGTLSIDSGNVYAQGEIAICSEDIVISGGKTTAVNQSGSQNQRTAIYANNSITVNDGEINVTATGPNCHGIYAYSEVNINAGRVIVNSTGTGSYNSGYGITSNGTLNILDGFVDVTVAASGTTLSNAYGLVANDTINISGGTVKVTGNNDYDVNAVYGDVVISGGDVTVNANGYYAYGFCEGSFTLSDGKVQVAANGTENCDAITSSSVTITGGELIAQSESYHSGAIDAKDSISISGGKVTATATGELSNGICCWSYNPGNGQIAISGGEVNATGSGNQSFGMFTNKKLTISGGKVVSKGENFGLYSENTMTIDNGIVSVSADGSEKAIYTDNQIVLGDELTITKPQNGTLNNEVNTIVDSGGSISKSVIIVNEHKYAIAVAKSEHGTVTSNRTKADDGDTVTLTVCPDKSCLLTSISVVDANTQEVSISPVEGGYTFTMPESNVTVFATFDFNWGEPSYEWADDYSTVTATRTCKDDDSIAETETVDAISQVTKPATCTEKGETTYTSVEFKNVAFAAQQTTVENIDALGHDWDEWAVTKEATENEEGLKTRVCNNDASHVETETIPRLDPKPDPQPDPIKPVILAKMTAKGKSSLVLTWNKVKDAKGYDIFFIKCGKSSAKKVKTIKGNDTLTWTKSGLKKKVTYKALVKAYVIKNGKKTYVVSSPIVHAYTSGGSKSRTNPKSVTVNKTKVSLKVGKTFAIEADVTKLQKNKELISSGHGPKLRYVSSNKKIATVSKSGIITAKAKGNCKVYVIAINGVRKSINVTVRQ